MTQRIYKGDLRVLESIEPERLSDIEKDVKAHGGLEEIIPQHRRSRLVVFELV